MPTRHSFFLAEESCQNPRTQPPGSAPSPFSQPELGWTTLNEPDHPERTISPKTLGIVVFSGAKEISPEHPNAADAGRLRKARRDLKKPEKS